MFNQKPLSGDLIDYGEPLSQDFAGLWLFNEGSGGQVYDLSGNRNDLSLAGTAYLGSGKFDSALILDGDSDYASRADADLSAGFPGKNGTSCSAFSISIWFNADALPGAGAGAGLFSKRDGASNIPFTCLIDGWNADVIAFVVETAGGTIEHRTNTTPSINTNYHLVATYDGAFLRTYLNGVLDGTPSAQTGDILTNTAAFEIGRAKASRYFNGALDIPIVYNYGLSASDAALLYQEPFRMVRTRKRRIIYDEIAAAPGLSIPIAMHHYKMLKAS